MPRITRYLVIGLVGACLGMSGCTSWDKKLRGDGFGDGTGRAMQQYRQPDAETHFWGFSNKAREIEQNFGAH